MSAAKQVLLALAAAYAAAAESLTQQADALEGGEAAPAAPSKAGKGANAAAPAPRAAVAGGKGGGKGGKKAAAPSVDFDTLKAKLMDGIVKDKGKEVAVACLDRFGAQKLSDLSAEQYEEFDKYLDDVISGEVDPLASGDTGSEDDLL